MRITRKSPAAPHPRIECVPQPCAMEIPSSARPPPELMPLPAPMPSPAPGTSLPLSSPILPPPTSTPTLAAASRSSPSSPTPPPAPMPTPAPAPNTTSLPSSSNPLGTSSLPSSSNPRPDSRSRLKARVTSTTVVSTAHLEASRKEKMRKQPHTKEDLVSAAKRKASGVKPPKAPPEKRFKSPTVPMSPLVPSRSTGIRMVLSPRTMSPSTELLETSQESPISPFINKRGTKRRNRRRKLTSKIWQEFDPIYDENGTLVQAQCSHCNQLFTATRKFGTSSCGKHLQTCKGKARLDQMISQLSSDMSSGDVSLNDWKFNQDVARNELVCLIVLHQLPFSLVEYPRFRSFCAALNPWFKPISRTMIRSDCIRTFEDGKSRLWKILSCLKSRISLTADLWTSNQTLGYLCVTAHYIDEDWVLLKRIIKFTLVETPHDGWTMFNALLKTLQDWNIESKIFSITLDNASVNDNFVAALQDNLVSKGQLLRKGKLLHCRCAAHVFNLIVQEGFNSISSATKNIRDSVKYVKSSQARKQRFEAAVDKVGMPAPKRPPLDVVTRWNSTYLMLITSLNYRRAYEALRQDDPQYTHEPSTTDWKMAKKLCNMLEPFYEATKRVFGSKYPTSSCYFHMLWEVQKELEKQSSNLDPVISTMVQAMKAKLKKYWDLSYLKICIPVIIDPRFKLGFLEFRLSKWFGDEAFRYISKVEKTFRKLFYEYSSEIDVPVLKKAQMVGNDDVDDSNLWADWGRQQNAKKRRTINELDKYLEEETMPVGVDLDILQFWKIHAATYPVLARMARDILAVLASTVASESAFSSAEKTVSDYRSRLKSETIEALICLQDWLRSDDSTSENIAGSIEVDDHDCI